MVVVELFLSISRITQQRAESQKDVRYSDPTGHILSQPSQPRLPQKEQ